MDAIGEKVSSRKCIPHPYTINMAMEEVINLLNKCAPHKFDLIARTVQNCNAGCDGRYRHVATSHYFLKFLCFNTSNLFVQIKHIGAIYSHHYALTKKCWGWSQQVWSFLRTESEYNFLFAWLALQLHSDTAELVLDLIFILSLDFKFRI